MYWKTRIVKVTIFFSKLTNRYNVIPIISSVRLFVDIDKIILKCIWKDSGIKIAEQVLYKVGEMSLRDFKTYYLATAIKTAVLAEV